MKKEKLLAGCVVLYNPPIDILKNINSYINYVDILFVIDNSDHISETLLSDIISISTKVRYFPQKINIGIASALNLASSNAISQEYSWLLTMDQDSYFLNGEFFDTWFSEINSCKIGLVAASYTEKYDQWQKGFSDNFNEIHYAITSGNILNLKAWTEVNFFEDKLFIDEVDHDFCLKLRVFNYKVLISKNIYLNHTIGQVNENNNSADEAKRLINMHDATRYYYISRNVLYVCKKYFFVDIRFASSRFFYLLRGFTKILFFYPDKSIYLRYFAAGVKDFALSKFNRYRE